jgi:hypothetical protein
MIFKALFDSKLHLIVWTFGASGFAGADQTAVAVLM